MISTTKCNYLFLTGYKMESFIFVSIPIKGFFWQFKWSWKIEFGKVHCLFGKSINSKCLRALLLGQRQKWMFPSCFLWGVVTFFGEEHVNWSSIGGVMIGKSWTIKSIIVLIPPIFSFPNWIFQLLPIITPPKLDQLTCSLPKNVTTFHWEQDGIIHFFVSPNERGVLALWIYIFTKKLMAFSKLDFLTWSYHNLTNTGPNNMFFTKKCNYFLQGKRWIHSFLS